MAEVKAQFFGDAADLNRELDKVNRKLAQMEAQQQKLADTSEKSGKAGKDSFEGITASAVGTLTKLGAMATSYLSISKGIDLVTEAHERQKQQAAENLTASERMAQAQEALLRNTGEQFDKFQAQSKEIAAETFVPAEFITEAASFAISAKGGESRARAMDAVRASARLSPNRPEDVPIFAQSALQIMNAVGPGQVTPAQALGFAQSAASEASTPETAQFFKNLAPVAFAGAEADVNRTRGMREASALLVAFTGRGDPLGDKSRTGAVNFGTNVRDFFADRENAPESFFGKLGVLQQDQALAEKFKEGGGLSGLRDALKTQGELLLDPNSAVSQSLLRIESNLAVSDQPFQDIVGQIRTGTPSLRLQDQARRLASSQQQFMLEHPELGGIDLAGTARLGATDAIGILGPMEGANAVAGRFQQGFAEFAFGTGGAPPVGNAIRRMQSDIARFSRDGITGDEQTVIDMLRRQIAVLEEIKEDARGGNSAANAQQDRHAEN